MQFHLRLVVIFPPKNAVTKQTNFTLRCPRIDVFEGKNHECAKIVLISSDKIYFQVGNIQIGPSNHLVN